VDQIYAARRWVWCGQRRSENRCGRPEEARVAAHPARATRLPPSSKKARETGKIGTIEGLAGLSLDALTSVAYGPEAIHRMLLNQRATILASVLRRHSTATIATFPFPLE
jgi:hypothetical protein